MFRTSRPDPRRWRPFLALALLLAIFAAPAGIYGIPTTTLAQSARTFAWHSIDVAIEVRPDGVLHITETHVVDFAGDPPFTFAFLEIPLDLASGITAVAVAELPADGEPTPFRQVDPADFDRDPGTYAVAVIGDLLRIDYAFQPTSGSEQRTFVVTYDAIDAVRVYPAAGDLPASEQVWWVAVDTLVTDLAPVGEARVTLTLPQAVPLDQVRIGENGEGDPAAHTTDGRTFTWSATALGLGDSLETRVAFPPILGLSPSAWQIADDARLDAEADRDRRNARINIAALALTLLLVVGGVVMLVLQWFVRGRDPVVGLVADILPEPPDDLAPGLAGTLIDFTSSQSDLVATLLDLGRREVLQLDDAATGGHPDLRVTLLDPDADLAPFERTLVADLFPGKPEAGATALMSTRPIDQPQKIGAQMFDALVALGYFPKSPAAVRDRYRRLGLGLVIAGFISVFVVPGLLDDARLVVLPSIGCTFLGFVALVLARAMPKRTLAGAEAAAKWRAFQRHLESLDAHGDLGNADDVLARYLPYATAFGVDRTFVARLTAAENPPAPPPYFGPVIITGPRRYERRPSTWATLFGGTGQGGDSNDSDGGGVGSAIGRASDRSASSLGAASAGLAGLLDAGRTSFAPKSSSSGSRSGGFGGGGGGGRGGGGGGGGSRGFG